MHGPIAKRTEPGRFERAWYSLLDPATASSHYWVAAGSVGLSLLLAFALHPWLGDRGVFFIFVPAVLLAASLGGLGPGLLATLLSVALGALLAGEGKPSSPAPATLSEKKLFL